MDIWDSILVSQATPSALALGCLALIITALLRGWVVPKSTVTAFTDLQAKRIDDANLRSEDYRQAWELSEKRADVLEDLVNQLSSVTETVELVLKALPPHPGDKED